MTLVELLAVVAIIGVVSLVLAGGITMILRNQGPISDTVARSSDRQRVVNYFPDDVAVASTDPAVFRTDGAPVCGGGTNVLSIDYASGASVSYVLDADRQLRRQFCDESDSMTVIRLSDHLADGAADGDGPVRAVVHAEGGQVTEVRLRLAHERTVPSGDHDVVTAQVRAAPRGEESLPPAPEAPPSVAATCDSRNPLAGAQGFLSFVEHDVHLGSGSQVYKAIGVGGEFSFSNGAQIAGHGGHPGFTPADVGLYARRVNWAASSGEVQINGSPQGHVIIVEAVEGVDLSTQKQANIMFIRGPGSSSPPQIKAQNGQLKKEAPGYAVNFPSAFERLRACSADLYRLPGNCPGCAVHVVPLHVNANPGNPIPYSGSGNIRIGLQAGMTNVLNVGEERLPQITNTPQWLGATPDQVDSLIVNVIDTNGDGVVNLHPINFSNHTTKVLWNFHGVHTVNINGGVWGTVFATDAHVNATGNIQGNLVARSFTHSGGVVNEARAFAGQVRWDG